MTILTSVPTSFPYFLNFRHLNKDYAILQENSSVHPLENLLSLFTQTFQFLLPGSHGARKGKRKKKKDRLKEGRNKKRPHQKSFNRRERYLLQENNTAVTASRTELRGLGQCSSQDPSRKQHPQTGELKKSFKRGYLQDIEGVGRVKR